MVPTAANTDYDSQAQTIVARGILEHIDREKHLDRYFDEGVEYAGYMGEGEIFIEWDPTAGDDYMPDQAGQVQKNGDVTVGAYWPLDIVRDPTLRKYTDRTWIIRRRFRNKYDLAAHHPDLAKKILALSYDDDDEKRHIGPMSDADTDLIPEYTLFHAKTPAVPQGRLATVLSDDLVLIDGPLPYRRIPGYRISSDDLHGTGFGYTVGYDLLPLQTTLDALYSTIVTNQANFGVQNVAAPRGSGVTVQEIVAGLNLFEYDAKGGPPTALDLLKTPKEIFEFVASLEHLMETLSGVNSVARGNPEASLKSGAALALVAAQAIQFASGLQKSYAKLLEDVGTAIIEILQDFATTPRMALIAGKNNRPMMKSFTNKDINKINRVTVDMGNPVLRTTAGKVEVANHLLDKGLVKTADEYLMVLQTGKLEPMIEGQTSELLLIKRENELLSEGKPCLAVLTDDHVLHIQENKTVLASPEARERPDVVQQTLAHLQQHIDLLKTMDPATAGLLKQPAIAPPPMDPMAGPADGGGGVPPGVMDAQNPALQAADKVKMPKMPKNPLNGQPAPVPANGAAQ
jgi:hypothetical protein